MTKHIAVFADGTNNSSAALFRTNVWRLYQALDTQVSADGASQLAYYHDGVGTSSFRPLAILGGAFGWGLKRNVLDCYKFICRNYRPDDRIYLFGFSRGAFTVRVLASLICHEGLVKPDSNRNLEIYARDAYRAYRRRFNWTGGLVGPCAAPAIAISRGCGGAATARSIRLKRTLSHKSTATGLRSNSSARGIRWRPMGHRSRS